VTLNPETQLIQNFASYFGSFLGLGSDDYQTAPFFQNFEKKHRVLRAVFICGGLRSMSVIRHAFAYGGGKELERHAAVKLRILRLVDHTHPAASWLLNDGSARWFCRSKDLRPPPRVAILVMLTG
jgi:hypothetical protein